LQHAVKDKRILGLSMRLFDITDLLRHALQHIGSTRYEGWLFGVQFTEVPLTLLNDVLEQSSVLCACSRSADRH
jgi:hypothetical protein